MPSSLFLSRAVALYVGAADANTQHPVRKEFVPNRRGGGTNISVPNETAPQADAATHGFAPDTEIPVSYENGVGLVAIVARTHAANALFAALEPDPLTSSRLRMLNDPGERMTIQEERINIADDHYCFGCGRLNPFGLHLHFYPLAEENGIWAPFTPSREHEGYMGMTHGGIITTVLDEVMAWSLYRIDAWAVTARLSVAFKQPIEVGVPARAIGRVIADRGRLLDVSGTIERLEDGVVLAESTAVFARVPKSQAEAWRERYSPS